MSNRLDRTQFEEKYWLDLTDKFIDKNELRWAEFVSDKDQAEIKTRELFTETFSTDWELFVEEEFELYEQNYQERIELEVEDYLLEQSRDSEVEDE